jgi:hypothetical protein
MEDPQAMTIRIGSDKGEAKIHLCHWLQDGHALRFPRLVNGSNLGCS